jgi:hypothetical protein
LATLVGSYRLWEEVMAHVADPGKLDAAAHAYPLDALLGLLQLAATHGFWGLAARYVSAVSRHHLHGEHFSQGGGGVSGGVSGGAAAAAAVVLAAAVRTPGCYGLAVEAFRHLLSRLAEPCAAPSGTVASAGEESWQPAAADAIRDFLVWISSTDIT